MVIGKFILLLSVYLCSSMSLWLVGEYTVWGGVLLIVGRFGGVGCYFWWCFRCRCFRRELWRWWDLWWVERVGLTGFGFGVV